MLGQTDGNIGRKALAHLIRVQNRTVALDNSCTFKFLDTAQACGWGQTDLFGQLEIADPAIARSVRNILRVMSSDIAGNVVSFTHGLQK